MRPDAGVAVTLASRFAERKCTRSGAIAGPFAMFVTDNPKVRGCGLLGAKIDGLSGTSAESWAALGGPGGRAGAAVAIEEMVNILGAKAGVGLAMRFCTIVIQ